MGAFQYLGGLVQTYANYKVDFLLMFFFGLLILALTIFKFEESHNQFNNKIAFRELMKKYAQILKDKRFLMIASGAGMGYSILLVFNVVGVFFLKNVLQVSPEIIGVIGIYFSLAYLFGGVLVNWLIKFLEIEMLITLGKLIIFLSGIFFFAIAITKQTSLTLIRSRFKFHFFI